MARETNNYFIGLDIGTTAVRCVIGHFAENDIAPNIIGVGKAPNLGVRKGTIVNINETIDAVDRAIEEAERIAGFQVDAATVNINGMHIVGLDSKGVIAISTNTREITNAEIERVQEAATVVQLPVNREIIQVFSRNYRLDGQDNIKDPLGMTGVRLEVDAHVITASTPAIKNLHKVLDGTGTSINHKLLSSLAASDAVIKREQRENGVVIVDIGASTTNVAVFEEGDVKHVSVIPVGSMNITNDLAIGLRTELAAAEKVKIEYGRAITPNKNQGKNVKVKVNSQEFIFDRKQLDMVVQARLDEIFELVDKQLHQIRRSGKLPGGAVIVGGGANLEGIADYAREKLRLPAYVAQPSGFSGLAEKVTNPEFATAIGLMLYDMHVRGDTVQSVSAGAANTVRSFSRGLRRFFRRFKV